MNLSIVIVNWNSIDFTIDCIASIRANVRELDYEVIVVDNASQDGSCPALTETYPTVLLLRSDRNVGFARANNFGAAASRGDKILFLNPDTKVLGNAIQTMVSRLDLDPNVGAVGCRLLNRDLTVQTSCVQPFPTILNQIFGLEFLQRFGPTARLLGLSALFSTDASREVEVVSGASLMVKRQVFDEVGQFSADSFMYGEEADLCYKIWRAGWRVVHVGDAQIVHYGGQSTKKVSSLSSEIMMRDSVFRLLCKLRGRAYAYSYRLALFLSAMLRLIILSPLLVIPRRLLNRDRATEACKKWSRIAGWSLSLSNEFWPVVER
jgi:N-acetylglucosaminyl-diphospho-decaprenol L-rhamnosyltransferase